MAAKKGKVRMKPRASPFERCCGVGARQSQGKRSSAGRPTWSVSRADGEQAAHWFGRCRQISSGRLNRGKTEKIVRGQQACNTEA